MNIQTLSKIAIGLGISTTVLMSTTKSASAITYNFDWTGDSGYSVTGSFSFDESTAPATISKSGLGATNDLETLIVSFFDPSSTPLGTFNNVVGGVSSYQYLNFNFDTVNESFTGFIDIGEDTDTNNPNEYYLFGTIPNLEIFNPASGTVDNGNSPINVAADSASVPFEFSPSLGLLLMGGIFGISRYTKSRKASKLITIDN